MNAQSNTLTSQRPPRRNRVLGGFCFFAGVGLLGAGPLFAPYPAVEPVLREHAPAELRPANEAQWLSWARRQDQAIRARLVEGDLDSMVNLLLYGTSFTKQPRIHVEGEGLAEASRSGVLRARVDDLVAGVRRPGSNERLQMVQRLVRSQGIDPEADGGAEKAGRFLLNRLVQVMRERKPLEDRVAATSAGARPDDPASLLDRASAFRDRGLALDTGIVPDYTIEQTLRDLKTRGVLREGQVARVAVIGPGLDFIDKNEESAYDYYPEQTVQPFALYDSLVRLGLAKNGAVSLSILDISSQVIEHVRHARERAAKHTGYVIQLPRDVSRPWPADLVAYWKTLGDQVGSAAAPIPPPAIFPGLETRAVRIRPEVVMACEPVDLDIVVQRLELPPAERFDLIVGTNIFVYYDAFEQALALQNAGAMLKPGGLLLTNDRLPETARGSMRLAGVTVVPLEAPGISGRQPVGWYRKK